MMPAEVKAELTKRGPTRVRAILASWLKDGEKVPPCASGEVLSMEQREQMLYERGLEQ